MGLQYSGKCHFVINLTQHINEINGSTKLKVYGKLPFQIDNGYHTFNGDLNGFATIKFAKYNSSGTNHGRLNQGLKTGVCFVLYDNDITKIRGQFVDNQIKVGINRRFLIVLN